MPATYWTKTGSDMWKLEERRVFAFKNLETGEVVTCDCATDVASAKFVPITMPKVKAEKPVTKKTRVKKTKVKKAAKSTRRGPRAKAKYKGVTPSKTPGKFRAQYWNKEKNIGLGTFDSELLAAAAYQEAIGNKKEAKRLRNEYEESDCRPEAETPQEDVAGGHPAGRFASEE